MTGEPCVTTCISIVTPSFNQAPFLPETIESVISQAGDFSIDYLIMDGGSTDGSVEIIRQYAAALERGEREVYCRGISFRWVSEHDAGQTDALTKGFRMARGDILAWLNSDDFYLPGALQRVAEFFRGHSGAALVYGDARYCDAAGKDAGRYHAEPYDLMRLAAANIICQPAAFFRKSAFDAAGGLDPSLDFVMDLDLWIRIGRQGVCSYLPGELAVYRLHDCSKTIAVATLSANAEEALNVVRRHVGWAPLTRVYTACSLRNPSRGGGFSLPALVCTLLRSLLLNRGLNRNDLRLLSRDNFRKLFRSRHELMTGEKP